MVRTALIGATLALLCSQASAECLIVSDVTGYSLYKENDYKVSDDSFGDRDFYIELQDNPRILGEQLQCGTASGSLVCFAETDYNTIIEVWTPDKSAGIVRMMRSRKMLNGPKGLENTAVYVGRITGSCD